MAVFEIQAPDGRSFQIEGANIAGAMEAVRQIPPAEAPMSGAGLAKAAGIGLAHGAIGLAGLPADALALGAKGVDALAGTNAAQAINDYGPTSENIQKAIETKTGEFYKPKNTAEEYASTIGSFAPAIVAGPGGLARRAATQVLAPAVASETAGQLTKGTDLEPYARVAGGVLGAAGGAGIGRALERPQSAVAPAAEELTNATRAGYQHPEVQALRIDPAGANRLVDRVVDNLRRDRFSEKQAGQTYDALQGLRNPEFDATHTLQDFDATRRLLNTVAASPGTDGEAARRAIRSIDAYTLRVPAADVVAGDARAAGQALAEGRASAAAGFRNERIQQVIERAQNTAGATHSGGNLENELRKQVRSIVNNPKQLRGFSAEERQTLQDFARGSVDANILRKIGKVLGGGGGLGQLAAGSIGASAFGPLGAVALPGLGMAANAASSTLALRRLNEIAAQVRRRSPIGQRLPQPITYSLMQRASPIAIAAALAARQPGGLLDTAPIGQLR